MSGTCSRGKKHCWHLLDVDFHATAQPWATSRENCCHCGKERMRTVYFHSRPTTKQHGRHAP